MNISLYLKYYNNKMSEEIDMICQPVDNNNYKVRIFGYDFVLNNKDKCKIIYKDKEYELKEYFNDIDNNYNNKDLLQFKLTGINHITNMSHMFHNCHTLISLPDISKWNTQNVENMSFMFCDCFSLMF